MWQKPVGPGSAWIVYVAVDDVEASTAKVKQLGGTVNQDITEVPNMGRFSIITDPSGATIGLWESTNG
jgi:predicted enzyme related to lactoylglutathione lyase